MSNIEMKQVTFEITGAYALLMHAPNMKRADEGMKKKTIPTPEDEAENGAYRMQSGQLFMPARSFRSAILDASKGFRIGKLYASQVMGSSLFALADECPLYDPDTKKPLTEYAVDVQRAVVQSQGVLRARPRLDKWATRVTFEYDPDFLKPELIEDAFSRAGKIIGVGDYRPRCPKGKGGPYGRFTVELL